MNGDTDIEYMKCIKKQLQPILAPVWIVGHWPKSMVDKWRTQQFMWTKSIASSPPFNWVEITLGMYKHKSIEVLNQHRKWGTESYWYGTVHTGSAFKRFLNQQCRVKDPGYCRSVFRFAQTHDRPLFSIENWRLDYGMCSFVVHSATCGSCGKSSTP